jgi:predicted ATPase
MLRCTPTSSASGGSAGIEEVIALRLDILTPSTRQVVEVASVLGRSFQTGELITACAGPRERVLLAIEELIYAQVLEAEGSHTLRFVHDKLPETIYARLPAAKRRELHAIAVRTLEASHSDGEVSERYAELAFHWQQAGQPEQAAQYWARAGAQSLKAMAYFDAVQHYEAALRNALDTHFIDDKLLLARWTRRGLLRRRRRRKRRGASRAEPGRLWVGLAARAHGEAGVLGTRAVAAIFASALWGVLAAQSRGAFDARSRGCRAGCGTHGVYSALAP